MTYDELKSYLCSGGSLRYFNKRFDFDLIDFNSQLNI